MASPTLLYHVPIRVFLASLQEYSAQIYQSQVDAEAESREVCFLRAKIAEFERENKVMRDHYDMLQRIADCQRELVISLETDLARASAESQFAPYKCEPNDLSSESSTLSLAPSLHPPEIISYSVGNSLPSSDLSEHMDANKRPENVKYGGSPKNLDREESRVAYCN